MILPAAKSKFSKTADVDPMPELAGIEVLRFLCAFAVLLWHYQHFFFVEKYDESQALLIRSMFPLHWLLGPAYEHGGHAVELFWAISGFIFFWRYAQPIFDRRVGLTEFAMRRFSRLYPLHIATLMLVVVLQYLYFRSHGRNFIYDSNDATAFLGQLFFASNWFEWQGFGFNGPIWSISIEILIYFTFFGIVRSIGATPTMAIAVSALSAVLFLGHRTFLSLDTHVFECAAFFFAGGFTQWLSQRLSKQPLRLVLSACVGIPTAALLVLAAIHMRFSAIDIRFAAGVILAVSLVLSFAYLGETKYRSVLKRFAFLGNATYSSYLVHFPIQLGMVTILDAMGYSRTVFFTPIALVAYLGLVIGISLAVYHLFELPAQKWIRSRTEGLREAPTIAQEDRARGADSSGIPAYGRANAQPLRPFSAAGDSPGRRVVRTSEASGAPYVLQRSDRSRGDRGMLPDRRAFVRRGGRALTADLPDRRVTTGLTGSTRGGTTKI